MLRRWKAVAARRGEGKREKASARRWPMTPIVSVSYPADLSGQEWALLAS
jgi:hypothetical protein